MQNSSTGKFHGVSLPEDIKGRVYQLLDEGLKRDGRRPLLAAALLGLLKTIEQAPGAGAGEGLQPVRLAFLDGVACDRSFGAKKLGLLLHFVVPHVWVELA